mmetsp:Transcript_63567/g.169806  ORF Transcript_63567/g.169806 Transcript_63567/m.169806 type:complete len:312 (-) Transcript_63567:24-959(-)
MLRTSWLSPSCTRSLGATPPATLASRAIGLASAAWHGKSPQTTRSSGLSWTRAMKRATTTSRSSSRTSTFPSAVSTSMATARRGALTLHSSTSGATPSPAPSILPMRTMRTTRTSGSSSAAGSTAMSACSRWALATRATVPCWAHTEALGTAARRSGIGRCFLGLPLMPSPSTRRPLDLGGRNSLMASTLPRRLVATSSRARRLPLALSACRGPAASRRCSCPRRSPTRAAFPPLGSRMRWTPARTSLESGLSKWLPCRTFLTGHPLHPLQRAGRSGPGALLEQRSTRCRGARGPRPPHARGWRIAMHACI